MHEWQTDNERTIAYYAQRLADYGIDPRALDWGSRASQERRFAALLEVGTLAGASVLDVGCGLADLLAYMESRAVQVEYTGYDITPGMIEQARARFPQARLEVCDLMQTEVREPQFDYVVASGIFYLRQAEPVTYMQEMVQRMFQLCRKGVAFTTLSAQAAEREDNEFYADPAQVLRLCLQMTPYVTLRHDYMPHDFTVYLYREPAGVRHTDTRRGQHRKRM